jgi:hypothetical protein
MVHIREYSLITILQRVMKKEDNEKHVIGTYSSFLNFH